MIKTMDKSGQFQTSWLLLPKNIYTRVLRRFSNTLGCDSHVLGFYYFIYFLFPALYNVLVFSCYKGHAFR